jgi:hypothetical protein
MSAPGGIRKEATSLRLPQFLEHMALDFEPVFECIKRTLGPPRLWLSSSAPPPSAATSPPMMEDPYSLRLSEFSLPDFGRLFHIVHYGYLGQTFGPLAAKRHLCYNILCYVEEQEDLVVSQELLRPEYSYSGLPRTFSVPHDLYSYLRCNSVAADGSRRIILDCEVAQNMRVVPQNLFAPYAGLPRSQSELQNASLVPPIFFILRDHSVGLRLDTARSAESRSPLLLYNDWCPLEGKASIKMRIEVRVYLLDR